MGSAFGKFKIHCWSFSANGDATLDWISWILKCFPEISSKFEKKKAMYFSIQHPSATFFYTISAINDYLIFN